MCEMLASLGVSEYFERIWRASRPDRCSNFANNMNMINSLENWSFRAAIQSNRRASVTALRFRSVCQYVASTRLYGLAAVAGLAVGLMSLLSSAASSAEASALEWGDASKGLRCRIVTVNASMSEEGVDLGQAISTFETPDELAFAVELVNTSNEPIVLLDTRYGTSYGKAQGKPKSDWFGQFLFTIDMLNDTGSIIDRPDVELVGGGHMILSGVLTKTLEPGSRHRFLLRPTKWLSLMTQRLAAGKFTAVVHYLGLPKVAADRIRGYRPKHSVLEAWSGDVASLPVSFQILGPANISVASDSWGPASRGLRAAVELIPSFPISYGEKVKLKLHVQNVGEKPVDLATHLWMPDLAAVAMDEQGNKLDVGGRWYSGVTPTGRVSLKPGQTAILDAGNLGIAANKQQASDFAHVINRTLVVPPGPFQIQLSGQLPGFVQRDGNGNVLAPLDGDWTGNMRTGFAEFVVASD